MSEPCLPTSNLRGRSFFTADEHGRSQCVYHADDVDAEIERLRAALEEAACVLDTESPVAAKRARKALSGDSSAAETKAPQNMHSDEWWQAELDRCIGVEQAKYRALFDAYRELQAGDPDITAGVKPDDSPEETPVTLSPDGKELGRWKPLDIHQDVPDETLDRE